MPTVKHALADLAAFGGLPAFDDPLHVGRPNVGDPARVLARIEGALERRWLTNDGELVAEFEERVAEATGARHCVATCNATAALQVAARALGLTGEVIVPAFTFVATAHAFRWLGLTPVLCDVDPRTGCLDPGAAERLVGERTSAIVPVHLWGRACAVDDLADMAARHGLTLLFDAAHALGCTYRGRRLGGLGDAAVFSFHATKVCNAFEGGALTTDDAELAARARLLKNMGFADVDRVVAVGTNAKMSEASAAMGLTSLEHLDAYVAHNRANLARYEIGLRGVEGVDLWAYPEGEASNNHYVVIEVDEESAGIGRDELVAVLHAENVYARRYFHPGVHRMQPYASEELRAELPATERLAARVICLPTGTAVGPGDVDVVCGIVRIAVEHASEAVRLLRAEASLR
jgi:dTDP-4-amino-4,6-dideoxygalactose transaminase